MFSFGRRSGALSTRYCIGFFAKAGLIWSVFASSFASAGCAEGVPPFGLVDTSTNAGTGGASGAGVAGMGSSGVGASGSGGSAGTSGSGGSAGSAGSGGSAGTSGADGGVPTTCVVAMCPEPPPPCPFVPAPAPCCKPDGACGAVDLFGSCS
jgi:hypothetical protein